MNAGAAIYGARLGAHSAVLGTYYQGSRAWFSQEVTGCGGAV